MSKEDQTPDKSERARLEKELLEKTLPELEGAVSGLPFMELLLSRMAESASGQHETYFGTEQSAAETEERAVQLIRGMGGMAPSWADCLLGKRVDDIEGLIRWACSLKRADLPELLRLSKLVPYARARRGERRGRSKGGQAKKRALGIEALIRRRLRESQAAGVKPTARELWEAIPEDPYHETVSVGSKVFEVYRDGDRLVQIRDSDGQERSIAFSTFQNYVTEIRRENLSK